MATATESTSELPPQAQAANLKTLTQAMGETKITDESKATDEPKADGEKSDKVEEGESLEDGEIREDEEEEEEDDGKPKTVFDSAKKFNLKVSISGWEVTLVFAALLTPIAPSIHALDTLL